MSEPATGLHPGEDRGQFIRRVAPRLIILAVLCVGIQALMALSYMGAFGKSEPSKAPFIVVSHHEGNAGYVANKLNALPSHPVVATISTDEAWAKKQVQKNKAVGVYVFNPSLTSKQQTSDLYYGSAQGAARAEIAKEVGSGAAQQAKSTLTTHDLVPSSPNDTRGTAPFYLVLAWMVGAYLLPSSMSTLVGTRAQSALGARLRLLLFAGYAVLSGLVGTALAQHGLDALRGDYWKISLIGMAVVFTVSTFTYGLTSIVGTAGIGMAIILFVILGNPSAGGAFNYDVLPQPWRTVGPWLPNGAGVDAVRSLSYFGGVDLTRPLWVLFVWFLVGLWMVFMVGNNTYRFAPGGEAPIEDDAVGVLGEYFEHHAHREPTYEGHHRGTGADPAESGFASEDEQSHG